jgi:hypothetical protein
VTGSKEGYVEERENNLIMISVASLLLPDYFHGLEYIEIPQFQTSIFNIV